jgi:Transaldolase/Fructose-6-phosphate aldolase
MATLLEKLRTYTTVVSDTGDIASIEQFKPRDATTNPSLIAAAAAMPAYRSIVDNVLIEAKKDAGISASEQEITKCAFKSLAVAFGLKILQIVPGRVSTEVDARLSFKSHFGQMATRPLFQGRFRSMTNALNRLGVLERIGKLNRGLTAGTAPDGRVIMRIDESSV